MSIKGLLNNSWFHRAIMISCIICANLSIFLIFNIDNIIHNQLYNHGLQFSEDWAVPYWTMGNFLYVTLALQIALSASLIGISYITKTTATTKKSEPKPATVKDLVLKADHEVLQETRLETQEISEIEQLQEAEPTLKTKTFYEVDFEPTTKSTGDSKPEPKKKNALSQPLALKGGQNILISCPNCKRVFSRPLLMLDFSNGRTEVVNTCPYCNRILGKQENEDSQKQKNNVQITDFNEEKVNTLEN